VSRRHWLLFVVLAAIWGAPYLFIKIAIEDLSPAALACTRTAIGAAVLLPLAARAGALGALRARLGALAALAAMEMAGPLWLIGAGERHVSSSVTGVLIASAPLFVALLALRVDHEERADGRRLVGLLVGIVGVALLLGLELGGDGQAALGGAMILLASFGYAWGALWLKRRFSDVEATAVMGGAMAISAVLLLPAALATASSAPSAATLGATAVLGVVCTAAGFLLFATLLRAVGAARSSTVAYLAPGFSVLFGVAFRGEALTAR
jgi:drug/metabolite transporter (DMT)-like permease